MGSRKIHFFLLVSTTARFFVFPFPLPFEHDRKKKSAAAGSDGSRQPNGVLQQRCPPQNTRPDPLQCSLSRLTCGRAPYKTATRLRFLSRAPTCGGCGSVYPTTPPVGVGNAGPSALKRPATSPPPPRRSKVFGSTCSRVPALSLGTVRTKPVLSNTRRGPPAYREMERSMACPYHNG